MAIGIIPNYILYLSMIIQEIIALLWLEYIYILLFYLNISFTTPTFRTHGVVVILEGNSDIAFFASS